MILRRSNAQRILVTCLIIVGVANAGKPSGSWKPASCPKCQSGSTPATPAQCPSEAPQSCTNIQEPDYCCPSDHYCTWANSKVACCPEGCECNSWTASTSWAPAPKSTWAPAPSSTWAPKSSWAPTSSWHATTSWAPSSKASSWVPVSSTTHPADCEQCQWRPENWNGQYCSTIWAHGPNLPTTAHAACGVVLVVNGADTLRQAIGWAKVIAMIVGLQFGGGLLLFRR